MKKLVALLMALAMVFTMVSCKKDNVLSYEEYAETELDEEVVVEGYVQDTHGWWEDKLTLYLQDEDGAYFVYDMECSEEDAAKMVPGTKIRVTGYKAEWAGEVEIIEGKFEFVDSDEEFVAEAMDVTELLGSDELIDHQNKFVSFKGLTVEAAAEGSEEAYLYSWDGSGSEGDDLYFNVSLNGEVYSFTVESYQCDSSTDVYKAVKSLKVGDVIDVEGFLYWYEGAQPHVTSVTVVG